MRVVASCFFGLAMFCSHANAVETTTPTPTTAAQPQAATNAAKPANAVAKPVVPTGPAPLVEMTPAKLAQKKADEDLKIKALVKNQSTRLQQLEKANLDALAQNQALQLKNDNLGVQVQVLQSERSAQLFMYGAATLGVGVLIGFMIASYVYTKRRRQW